MEHFQSDLEFAITLSKIEEISKNYIHYPIPKEYSIQAELLDIKNGDEFYKLIIQKIKLFDKFLLKSIINAENQNSLETRKVFYVQRYSPKYQLFCKLRSICAPPKYLDKFNNSSDTDSCDSNHSNKDNIILKSSKWKPHLSTSFMDFGPSWCNFNGIKIPEEFVILRGPMISSLTLFYNLLRIIGCGNNLILHKIKSYYG